MFLACGLCGRIDPDRPASTGVSATCGTLGVDRGSENSATHALQRLGAFENHVRRSPVVPSVVGIDCQIVKSPLWAQRSNHRMMPRRILCVAPTLCDKPVLASELNNYA
jgi:hypothetical protein